jgi:hypothetical protein
LENGARRRGARRCHVCVGIGSATAIFTVVTGVLLRPLPYPDGERFVSLSGARTTEPGIFMATSVPELHDYQQQTTSFDAFGWFRAGRYHLTAPGEPQFVPGAAVTTALARQLGSPLLGQWFADDTPLDPSPRDARRGSSAYFAYAHRKSDVSLEQAQADVKRVAAIVAAIDRQRYKFYTADVVPLREWTNPNLRATLQVLLGGAGLLLLIACANVATLLLARSVSARGRRRSASRSARRGANSRSATSPKVHWCRWPEVPGASA